MGVTKYERTARQQSRTVGVRLTRYSGDGICFNKAEQKRLSRNLKLLEARVRSKCKVIKLRKKT